MCYEDGGIVDDLLVYRLAENEFLLVINASNIEKDFEWMKKNNPGAELQNKSDEYSLLAVQGPNSKKIIQKLTSDPLDMEYYHFMKTKVNGIDMIVIKNRLYRANLVMNFILRVMRKLLKSCGML